MRSRLILMTVAAAMATCHSNAEQAMAQADKQLSNSIGMKLVLIPKGTFQMGSPESEEGHEKNETHHEVTISENHYLGVTEVTQEQY